MKLFISSGKEEPDDVNNFTKSFTHILNLKFIVHIKYYFINGVTFSKKERISKFY